MRKVLGLVAVLCLTAGTAGAADAPSGESLLMPPPDGFKIGYAVGDAQFRMTEFVPAKETVENWSQMVTQQVFVGRGGADPEVIQQKLLERWKTACAGGSGERLDGEALNGYRSSLWSFACPRNPATGKPEVVWIKVISGTDSGYVAQYAFRQIETPERRQLALDYIARVNLCDTRTAEHPCPSGVAAASGAKP